MEKKLTVGNPYAVIWKFSLPVIFGNIFQMFYTMADSIIVGRILGADALAAVGATNLVVFLILCFLQGLTSGFGIVVGQYFGAKDEKNLKKSLAASIQLSILLVIILTVVSCCIARPMLNWINTPTEIISMSYDYVIVIFLGIGATVFYNWISNVLRALGDSKTPLYFLIISSILNIVLDIVFILPLGMGIAGAAWATIISQLISAILCTIYALKRFEIIHLKRQDFSIDFKMIMNNLKVGFPMGFQMSVMCIGLLVMQTAINDIGTNAIAGYTAANKVDQLSSLVNNAFGVTIANFVAQNYGARKLDRIKKGVTACLVYTLIANVILASIIYFLKPFIVPMFITNPNPEIIEYANQYFMVVVPFYLLLGVLLVYRSAVQSMGDFMTPLLACIIELFTRVICTIWLGNVFGFAGICFSISSAWFGSSALVAIMYFLRVRRIQNQGWQ